MSLKGARDITTRISQYIAQIEYYDYLDLAEIIVSDIVEYFSKSNPRNLENRYARIAVACRQASFLGPVCSICLLIRKFTEIMRGRSKEEFKKWLETFSSVTARFFTLSDRTFSQISSRLVENLPHDSVIVVMSHTHTVARIIGSLRYKIHKVYVSKKYPLNAGVTIAKEIRAHGVNVSYIPDEYLAWAIEQADMILGFALGTTTTARIVTETGLLGALATGEMLGVDTIIIAPLNFMCGCDEEDIRKKMPGFVVSNEITGVKLKLRSLDLIDPDSFRVKLVNENEVIDASRELIIQRQKQLDSVINDTINYISRERGLVSWG